LETIDDLFEIIRTLRSENGCVWDKKQTPETMWKCLVEESYELQDALAKNDLPNVCEELGDVLFQLLFMIEIFQENKNFILSDIVGQVARKMVRRHPHVYEDTSALTEQELNEQWAAIKAKEKQQKGQKKDVSVLEWDDIHGVLDTVRDEIDEFEAALANGSQKEINLEFGDILFSLVNVARFANIYPENALADATAKFDGRFRIMEKQLRQRQVKLKDLSRQEVDQLWDLAKKSHDE